MFAFERTKLKDWVNDIKALIQKDLRGIPGWGAHTRSEQQPAMHLGGHTQCMAQLGMVHKCTTPTALFKALQDRKWQC